MSLSSDIEGTLFKWTNYWGGWQPRWVVLNNGILSYYNSIDEVSKGCRASIKISASDIIAYPADNTRLDVVVANEQRWYLKANSAAERQAWLIALGTSKANAGKESNRGFGVQEASDELKRSMSEVRLFCDLLVQQAVKVKSETQKEVPDTTVLSESSELLSTTCDTFLSTLGRCIDISEKTFGLPTYPGPMLRSLSHDGQLALPQRNMIKARQKKKFTRSIGRSPPKSPSISVHSDNETNLPASSLITDEETILPPSSKPKTPSTNFLHNISSVLSPSSIESTKTNNVISVNNTTEGRAMRKQSLVVDVDDEAPLTFFSAMLHSFSDIVLFEDGGIPTLSFLSACEGIIPFLDTIGSTAFAPVRMDFMGNISKLQTKHASDTTQFKTLQSILEQEIRTSTAKVRNSATDALMWLKRGLRFMQKFLFIFKNGERNLTLALNQAYSATLKPYHGWVVKGIFALAVKAAPYPKDFIRALSINPDRCDEEQFLSVLLQDIDQYTTAMDVVLNIVDNFYESHNLESSAVV